MRARTVNENISFERGVDPKEAMGIEGRTEYSLPAGEVLEGPLKNKAIVDSIMGPIYKALEGVLAYWADSGQSRAWDEYDEIFKEWYKPIFDNLGFKLKE